MQELRTGCTLQGGKYRIERVLGQGGYGITYEGLQTGLNRRVAIKEFFLKEYCEREGQTSHVTSGTTTASEIVAKCREKFIKEAQMIASFDRAPHIVRIYDIFEENGTAYYVMEYVEGGSLASLVEKSGPLPVSRAINLIRQTGQALSYLHSRQTMHLDVKPANLLLRREEDGSDNVVLIDFGISKHYDAQGHATTTSFVTYSRGFASLEQYREGGVQEFSPTSDIYSLGATLYFLLTGQTPPDAMLLVEEPLERPSAISPDLWQIISRAMSTSRKKRYQTVDEMMQALKGINLATTSSPVKLATITSSKVKEETIIASPKDEKTIVAPSKDKITTVEPNNLILKDNKPKPTPSVEQRENNESEEGKPSTKTRWLAVACIVAMIGIVFFFIIRGTSDITQVDTSDSQVKMDGIYEVGDLSKATDLHFVYNKEKRLCGMVDQAGRLVMPIQWERVNGVFSEEGLMAVRKDGKWGFIDKQGNLVIPYRWDYCRNFSEGLAAVCDGNKWGFIDTTGKLVIPCIWAEARSFNEGLAGVHNGDGSGGFINKEGKIVIPCRWNLYGFSEGLAPVQDKSGLCGFVNTQGELVIGYKWPYASPFSNGLAYVHEEIDKGFKFIDKNGKVVLSFGVRWRHFTRDFSEGLTFIEDRNSHNKVCINKSGKTVFECKWDNVGSFSDGLAAVLDYNGKWGYIDKTGTLVIPCQWDCAYDFSDGKAWVMIGTYGSNTYRQIDKTGKYVE